MPKNVKGGSKHKKMKNNSNSEDTLTAEKILKSGEDQDYGKVEKILGSGRFTLICNDNIRRLGIIRGNMRKKKWVNLGNIVIYSVRDYEKDKVDIIHVYTNNILKLIQHKMNLNFNISDVDNDDDIFITGESEDIISIPQKKQVTNSYYNFSDSDDSDENNYEYEQTEVVDEQFIDDL